MVKTVHRRHLLITYLGTVFLCFYFATSFAE